MSKKAMSVSELDKALAKMPDTDRDIKAPKVAKTRAKKALPVKFKEMREKAKAARPPYRMHAMGLKGDKYTKVHEAEATSAEDIMTHVKKWVSASDVREVCVYIR